MRLLALAGPAGASTIVLRRGEQGALAACRADLHRGGRSGARREGSSGAAGPADPADPADPDDPAAGAQEFIAWAVPAVGDTHVVGEDDRISLEQGLEPCVYESHPNAAVRWTSQAVAMPSAGASSPPSTTAR